MTSAVTPPSQLDVLAMSADSTDGVLSTAFTLNLSATDAAKLSAFDIIYSQGSLDSSGDFVPHPVQPSTLVHPRLHAQSPELDALGRVHGRPRSCH